MIATWCTDKKSKNWPKALLFIQVSKNRRLHSGIGRTPYQAMFGRENDRCKCRRNKRVCNSKCHGSKSCKNSDNQ